MMKIACTIRGAGRIICVKALSSHLTGLCAAIIFSSRGAIQKPPSLGWFFKSVVNLEVKNACGCDVMEQERTSGGQG